MSLRALVMSAALFAPAFAQPAADAPTGDARIAPQLKEGAIDYKVDKDGDYRIEYSVGGGRTQIVFVNSKTEKLGDKMEIREIWAAALRTGTTPLKPEDAADLLERSSKFKLGAWELRTLKDEKVLVFCARVPAEISSEELKALVRIVAETADEREKVLSGDKDDL